MITFAYKPENDKAAMRQFFEILPFVLPCKFCRSNLVKHYEALPLEPALKNKDSLSQWFYEIHGLVNETLRGQGQSIPKDPPFSKVQEIYEERLQFGCSKTDFPGWEFLFSIIESHPLSQEESPLPHAPPKQTLKTKKEMLEWNYLSGQCRFSYVCRFWKLLPSVLPFPEWRTIWNDELKDCCNTIWKTRSRSRKALWKVRHTIEEKLSLLNRTTYHDLCKSLQYYKSGCAYKQNKNSQTCRRLRSRTRKHKID
jgi:hypothetical protein